VALLTNGKDMKSVIAIFLIVLSSSLYAQTKAAMVKMIRGEVDVLTLGKTTRLKINDWVESGAVIKTGDKSFARLVFIDKSTMNVSANSEMKIEAFTGKDSGVIDLVKGSIRSTVTKDYLQIKERDKSKLFIKTQNAVMGVRGTEFDISTNGITTATVLFEGEIAFNKLNDRGVISTRALEDIVDRGVMLAPQDFSVVQPDREMPTVPAKLNPQQYEALQKNPEFNTDRSPSNANPDSSAKSVVPEGLSGKIVTNDSATLKSEVGQVVSGSADAATDTAKPAASASSADPEGYVKGNLVKPANGSFLHMESGTIIPPDPNAVLDSNTNTYIAGSDSGTVAPDGSYIPPKNVEITSDGKILVATTDSTGAVVVKEVPPPSPVVVATATPIGSTPLAGSAPLPGMTTTTTKTAGDIPLPGPGSFDSRFTPTGGIINVNDPTRQSTLIPTTIIVNP
jgi:hypothetical protein